MTPSRPVQPRQNPVSCRGCRKRKLKCDRQRPCSNCSGRKLMCEFQTHNDKPEKGSGRGNAGENIIIASGPANDNTADRLARLEAAVFGPVYRKLDSSHDGHVKRTSGSLAERLKDVQVDAVEEEEISMDSSWLQAADRRNNTQQTTTKSGEGRTFTFVLADLCLIDHSISNATSSSMSSPLSVFIPHRATTIELFNIYIKYLHSMQYIMYTPCVTLLIHRIYDDFERNNKVLSSDAGLLLGILANVSAFWSWGGAREEQFSALNARSLTLYWLEHAMDTLDNDIRFNSSHSLETVQTAVLIVFLLFRLDGFSTRLQHYHDSSITVAKAIGLHVVDAQGSRKGRLPSPSLLVDVEMRRRIWWHLCSTDWCLPFVCDIALGAAHSIDPRYMRVRRPRNINDEDLDTQDPDFERPLSEKTDMTYYLYRIRLGELCREISDLRWSTPSLNLNQIPYDQIILVDKKFDDLADGLPSYLSSDVLAPGTSPSTQQSFARLTTLARRAKLHLPFMLRVKRNSKYGYSRDVCLMCARSMLQMSSLLPTGASSSTTEISPLTGTLHHFFFATVVLVMDLCANPGTDNDDIRRAEMMAAYNVLQNARTVAEPSKAFLNSLRAIMQKHGLNQSVGEQSTSSTAQDVSVPFDTDVMGKDDFFELQSTLDEFLDFDLAGDTMEW